MSGILSFTLQFQRVYVFTYAERDERETERENSEEILKRLPTVNSALKYPKANTSKKVDVCLGALLPWHAISKQEGIQGYRCDRAHAIRKRKGLGVNEEMLLKASICSSFEDWRSLAVFFPASTLCWQPSERNTFSATKC